MAVVVVDGLEAVEVEVGHRQLFLAADRLQHRLLHAIRQQNAVGQVGQHIKVGDTLQLPFMGLALRDVAADHDKSLVGLGIRLQGCHGEFKPVFAVWQGEPVSHPIGITVLHRLVNGVLTGSSGIGRQEINNPFAHKHLGRGCQ